MLMTNYWKGLLIASLTLLLSCTDGSQAGTTITQLIEEQKITKITLQLDGETTPRELPTKDLVIKNQFLKAGNDYISLSDLKIIKVKGKELELILD